VVGGDLGFRKTKRRTTAMALKDSNDAFKGAFDKMAANAFQGSGPAFGDIEAEVEGHVFDDKAYEANAFQSDDPAFGDDAAAPEVEGHLHPILMEDYSRVQMADSEAEIARAQRAREARTDRDGGVLDKVLRRKMK
jgi:hypothetical protein